MSDGIHDKLQAVTASEVVRALAGEQALSEAKIQAADANDDGRIDVQDVEILSQAQIRLANKISGAIVGMEQLSPEEQAVADQNGDGYTNLTDSYRLADDARAAQRIIGKLRKQKKI
jgi:hypothetical protein